MIELTHGQPYLLQALASDLVNHLNAERRLRASRDILKNQVVLMPRASRKTWLTGRVGQLNLYGQHDRAWGRGRKPRRRRGDSLRRRLALLSDGRRPRSQRPLRLLYV
jgi:hypothetical protein